MSDLSDIFGAPIAIYSMTQALAERALVDAGPIAHELFAIPVIITAAAWTDCVAWSETDSEQTGAFEQSETGRVWDVLWMTWCSRIRLLREGATKVQLYRIPRGRGCTTEPQAELVTLRAVLAANDDGTPVIVIGFPEED